ncbi:MAG: caspase family protein [Saprospiraceae bacterium]|nr:caspase family protein [Saprospiraceae bacterium]
MKYLFLFCALALAYTLSAQNKGIAPLDAPATPTGTARAVVIGISDYQDERITNLQYAHRDAQAFAEWLHSPAGGVLPEEQINLLTNSKATLGNIVAAFDWLLSKSKTGDRAIIYFSGHGDVEKLTMFNRGYLLAHDAPGTTYMAGGAVNLRDLQDIISTLSENGVQVVMISDACRAGKLAGSETGGTHTTTAELAKQFASEIKILSCQPEELSLEGEQWGGGRGCFSYHLTEGLTGLADGDANLRVELREIGRYLQDRVAAEVEPHRQLPMTVGSPYTPLAQVDKSSLDDLIKRKEQENPSLMATKLKGIDDLLPARSDSSVREIYDAFVTAIEKGELLQPEGRSANDFYERLMQQPGIEDLQGIVKRNFAAALQDEAQQVVNKLLRTDPAVADDAFPGRVRYAHLPACLGRASEILGEGHYMYRYLKAKQYFFEAKMYTKAQYPGLSPDSLSKLSMAALNKGLEYDPEAAYIHLAKGVISFYWDRRFGMAAKSFDDALSLSPTWVLAMYYYARAISQENQPTAVRYLKEAVRIDSTFLPSYERLGYYTSGSEQIYWRNEYVRRYKQWEERDPEGIPPVYMRYMGFTFLGLGRNKEAEKYLLKGAEMTNWEDPLYYQLLGYVYSAQGRHADMCRCFDKFSDLMPNHIEAYTFLVNCGKIQKATKLAWQLYKRDTTNLTALDGFWFLQKQDHQFSAYKTTCSRYVEIMEATKVYDDDLFTKGNQYWWYGFLYKAEVAYKEHIRQIEALGDTAKIRGLKREFGPYGQLASIKLIQGNWKEAESWWSKRDTLDTEIGRYSWWAWIAFSRGQTTAADSLLELAYQNRQIDPTLVLSEIIFLASTYGLFDYSIFCLEKAAKHYPDHANFPYHLARLYIEQKNDYEKGVPLLEQAVRRDKGSHAPAHYHLAAAYARLGKNEAALEHLQKALELGYDYLDGIVADTRWERLRGTERYRVLMNRYFPD